jgi:hypothetical protein
VARRGRRGGQALAPPVTLDGKCCSWARAGVRSWRCRAVTCSWPARTDDCPTASDLGLVSIDGHGDGDEIRNAALTLLLVYLY